MRIRPRGCRNGSGRGCSAIQLPMLKTKWTAQRIMSNAHRGAGGRTQRMTEGKDLLCKRCNHLFSLHIKKVRDADTRADAALLPSVGGNISSSTASDEAGCSEPGCSCPQYIQ